MRAAVYEQTEIRTYQSRRVGVLPLANAACAVAAAVYVLCAALSVGAPEVLVVLFGPWFHNIRPDVLAYGQGSMTLGQWVLGFFTFSGAVWLAAGAMAWLYNRWTRPAHEHV